MHRRLTLVAALVTMVGFAATGTPTRASADGSCSTSTSYTWTGDGDNQTWTDPNNWSGEHVPTATDSAIIEGSADAQMDPDIDVPSAICNLTIGDNTGFEPSAGGITVNGKLDWNTASNDSEIEGAVVVAGTAELSTSDPDDANLELVGGDDAATITVEGTATIDPDTYLELGGSPDALTVDGSLHVSDGDYLWSNASGGDFGEAAASLDIHGAVTLDGDAHTDNLDWNLDPVAAATPEIDLAGHTLTMDSAGNSRWLGGGRVTSSSGQGVIDERGGLLMVDGTTTLDKGVTLRLDDSGDTNRASLSDGTYWASAGGPTGAAASFAGQGTVDLSTGTLYGTITLGSGITTQAHGDDTRVSDTYGPGSVLINRGTMNVTSGTFDGSADTTPQVRNYGTVRIATGTTVSGFTWTNEPGSSMSFTRGTGVPATTPAEIDRVTMTNAQMTSAVADGARAYFDDGVVVLDGATLTGGGRFQSGNDNNTLYLLGTTTVAGGTTLMLGDTTGYSYVQAGHAGGGSSTPARLNGGAGGGKLAFVESEIKGQLAVNGKIATSLTPSDNYHEIGSGSGFTHGLLSLAGPTSIAGTSLDVDGDSQLDLGGKVSVSGGSADSPAGFDGAGRIVLAKPGDVTVAPHSHAELGYGTFASAGHLVLGAKANLSAGTVTLAGGTFAGSGTLTGNLVNKAATVNPGTSAGSPHTLTIVGNYRQGSHGKLELDVRSGALHDALAVHGSVALNGTLIVADANKTHPKARTHIRGAVTATGRTGKFHHVTSLRHPKKRTWHVNYPGHRVDLILR